MSAGGAQSDEASAEITVDGSVGPSIRVEEIVPPSCGPGDLVTLSGAGFQGDPALPTVVKVGNIHATIREVGPDRLTFEAPRQFTNSTVTVLNSRGFAHSPRPLEARARESKGGLQYSRMGRIVLSGDEDLLCAQQFPMNEQGQVDTSTTCRSGRHDRGNVRTCLLVPLLRPSWQ